MRVPGYDLLWLVYFRDGPFNSQPPLVDIVHVRSKKRKKKHEQLQKKKQHAIPGSELRFKRL